MFEGNTVRSNSAQVIGAGVAYFETQAVQAVDLSLTKTTFFRNTLTSQSVSLLCLVCLPVCLLLCLLRLLAARAHSLLIHSTS